MLDEGDVFTGAIGSMAAGGAEVIVAAPGTPPEPLIDIVLGGAAGAEEA